MTKSRSASAIVKPQQGGVENKKKSDVIQSGMYCDSAGGRRRVPSRCNGGAATPTCGTTSGGLMPWPGMQRGTIEKVADLQSASEAYKNLFLLAGMVVTPPCFLGDTDTHDLARLCATDF